MKNASIIKNRRVLHYVQNAKNISLDDVTFR